MLSCYIETNHNRMPSPSYPRSGWARLGYNTIVGPMEPGLGTVVIRNQKPHLNRFT